MRYSTPHTQKYMHSGPPVQTAAHTVTSIHSSNVNAVRGYLPSKRCLHHSTHSEVVTLPTVVTIIIGEKGLFLTGWLLLQCFPYAGLCKVSLKRNRMNIKHLLSSLPVSPCDSADLSCLQSCAINGYLSPTFLLRYKSAL